MEWHHVMSSYRIPSPGMGHCSRPIPHTGWCTSQHHHVRLILKALKILIIFTCFSYPSSLCTYNLLGANIWDTKVVTVPVPHQPILAKCTAPKISLLWTSPATPTTPTQFYLVNLYQLQEHCAIQSCQPQVKPHVSWAKFTW